MKQLTLSSFIFIILYAQVFSQSEDAAPVDQRQSNLDRMKAIFQQFEYTKGKTPCEPNFEIIRRKFLIETFVWDHQTPKLTDDDLVSPYAFRKEIKKTFTTLVLGNDDASKVNRYATLDVSEKPAFSFSPFVFESNPKKYYYNNIIGVTFSGKLSDESVFRLKDFRDLKAGVYWVYLLNLTNYKPKKAAGELQTEYICSIQPDVDKIIEDYKGKFKNLCSQECLDDKSKGSQYTSLGDKFIEEVTDVEITASDNYWASKNFFWIRPELLLGYDKISYLSKDSLTAKLYKPLDKKFFTATLKLSGNYFHQKGQNKGSFLASAWASIDRKHTFSEVLKADDFQIYQPVNDTISQLVKTNNVFITEQANVESGLEMNFGFRTVRMFSLPKDHLVGLSFSFTRKGLIYDGDFPSLFTTEAGLVFPFPKPDGKSTFNLEIFYKSDVYSNFPASNDRFLGFRFNVPIGS